jgi:hypothetical protein
MTIAHCSAESRMVDECIGTAGLVQLWSEVLEVPDVDASDDFFNLGGNSLRAIEMLAQISQVMNLQFTTRVLYENPTPAAFHERLHETAGP